MYLVLDGNKYVDKENPRVEITIKELEWVYNSSTWN
jgi:hypothetical protein